MMHDLNPNGYPPVNFENDEATPCEHTLGTSHIHVLPES